MKTNRIHQVWIMLISTLIVAYSSVKTILFCSCRIASRKQIDQECRRWARRLLWAVKAKYTLHNPHQVDITQYNPCIIMANHRSHYDIPLCLAALPGSIRMLAKKELRRVPLFGRAILMAEFPFVNRQNPRQAIKDLKEVKQLMQSGIIIWMAPEGSRSHTKQLQQLKRGGFMLALKTGATIIPIGIDGSEKILPTKTTQFTLNQKVNIRIGQPVNTKCYAPNHIEQLRKDISQQIRFLSQQ